MPNSPIDILILTNGPGELATWVRPVVQTLRQQLGEDRSRLQISVVLSPCPNASGKEADIARSYPEIDRVQGAADFGSFLLWGKTAQNWDWRKKGVVLFLGGDQLFTAILGRRLGYRTVVYAEWEARWHRWIDRFGVTKPEVMAGVSPQYAHKFTVVGDLMADIQSQNSPRRDPPTPLKKQHSSFPPFPVQDSPRRDSPTPLIRGLSSVPLFKSKTHPEEIPQPP